MEGESYDDLIDALVALQRTRAQAAALEASLLVRIAGMAEREYPVSVVDHDTDRERILTIVDEAREEVAAALHRSPNTMHDQIVTARLLFGPLLATRDALAAGDISEGHVRAICDQARRVLRSLPAQADAGHFAEVCRLLQDRVLPVAPSLTVGQTRILARRAVEEIDAEGERSRRDAARRLADVSVYPEDDGMAVLIARLREVDARRVAAAIDARAGAADLPADGCASAGERRAAALVDLACGRGTANGVDLTVTIPLDQVLDPAGPIGHLLDDPDVPISLRRLLTDPQTGCALDLGRSRYEVSDALRRWITVRDRTCAFPGCSRSAAACDIDHVVAWDDGGRTDAANLQPLCRRHHQFKTFGLWQVQVDDDGARTWVSPRGRRHRPMGQPMLVPAGRLAPEHESDPPAF